VYEERLRLNFEVKAFLNESFEVAECHMLKIVNTNNTSKYSIMKSHQNLIQFYYKGFLDKLKKN